MKFWNLIPVTTPTGRKADAKVLYNVTCDCCGKSCDTSEEDGFVTFGFMDLKATWGYSSPNDLTEWTAQVCEHCVMSKLRDIITFKVKDLDVR